MTTFTIVRSRFNNIIRRFVKDENGSAAPIETILLIALSAALLTLGFKYLWGSENKGVVATMIDGVMKAFSAGIKLLMPFS